MTIGLVARVVPLALVCMVAIGRAQQAPIGAPVPPLGAGPFVFDTAEQHKIRVTVMTRGLSHPWAIAFLPDGGMLVTERPGRIRVIRNGVLDPTPIAGVPRVRTDGNGGLMDIAHSIRGSPKIVWSISRTRSRSRTAKARRRSREAGSMVARSPMSAIYSCRKRTKATPA